jgi:hypothetical protein
MVAHAEEPWAVGVSKGKQTRAIELFKKGNELFEESKYTEALPEYEKALKLWDNPQIHYNLVRCLIDMRQPLEAWTHIEKALKYGEEGLGKRVFSEAMTVKATLEASLAELDVSSEQDDVEVTLDGTELFTGKDHKRLHLKPGSHQLSATADGFQTESKALNLPPGELTKEVIELEPEKVKIKVTKIRENYDRRWAWWIPWATAGTSVALALIGTGVYVGAHSDIQAYDAALLKQCPQGCAPSAIPASLTAQQQHAEHQGSIAIGLWSVGGAVAVAAGVMAILNRPRLVEGKPDVSVVATHDYIGVGVALTFR